MTCVILFFIFLKVLCVHNLLAILGSTVNLNGMTCMIIYEERVTLQNEIDQSNFQMDKLFLQAPNIMKLKIENGCYFILD